MIDDFVQNPKSPKYHVKKFLSTIAEELKGKIVLDIPAGNGATTEILQELGCKVEAFDLFPEYFMLDTVHCERANIIENIPRIDSYADFVICQEGMEHFSDQLKVLKELNRVLKKGGRLLITTPSYSNLKAKLSYLLFESEYFNKFMPPNEIESIWMSQESGTGEIYHGHIFLTGIQRLRILAKLAGFKISKINFMRLSKTSLLLFPLFYPFIVLSSYITYFKTLKKHDDVGREIFKEQLKININPKVLLDQSIFVLFEKENELNTLTFSGAHHKAFNEIM
jgi:SAM-dependent methyltransferase